MKKNLIKRVLQWVSFLMLFATNASALTDYFTNTSWQYWNGSSWVPAQLSPGNYCNQVNPISGASVIWGATNTSGQTYKFRLIFTIPNAECNLCNRVDSIYSYADDSCAVYINGVQINLSLGSGGSGLGSTV